MPTVSVPAPISDGTYAEGYASVPAEGNITDGPSPAQEAMERMMGINRHLPPRRNDPEAMKPQKPPIPRLALMGLVNKLQKNNQIPNPEKLNNKPNQLKPPQQPFQVKCQSPQQTRPPSNSHTPQHAPSPRTSAPSSNSNSNNTSPYNSVNAGFPQYRQTPSTPVQMPYFHPIPEGNMSTPLRSPRPTGPVPPNPFVQSPQTSTTTPPPRSNPISRNPSPAPLRHNSSGSSTPRAMRSLSPAASNNRMASPMRTGPLPTSVRCTNPSPGPPQCISKGPPSYAAAIRTNSPRQWGTPPRVIPHTAPQPRTTPSCHYPPFATHPSTSPGMRYGPSAFF